MILYFNKNPILTITQKTTITAVTAHTTGVITFMGTPLNKSWWPKGKQDRGERCGERTEGRDVGKGQRREMWGKDKKHGKQEDYLVNKLYQYLCVTVLSMRMMFAWFIWLDVNISETLSINCQLTSCSTQCKPITLQKSHDDTKTLMKPSSLKFR